MEKKASAQQTLTENAAPKKSSGLFSCCSNRAKEVKPDLKNKSFFKDVDMTGGYLDMQNEYEDKIWYTYTKCFDEKILDAPLVIAHPGGPGFISQMLLTNGGGPLEVKCFMCKLKKAKDSYVEFADLLIADLPSGTGFSKTNFEKHPKNMTVEQFMKVSIDFFDKLNADRPELKIKERNLIFYGISYGTGFWLYVAKALEAKGYKISGMFLDSGYVSARAGFETFVETMVEHNILGEGTVYDPKGEKLEKYKKDCDNCAKKLLECGNTEQLSKEDGAKFVEIYEGSEIYKINGKATEANIYD